MTIPVMNSAGPVVGTPGGSNINAVITAPSTIGVDDILVLTCLTNSTTTLTSGPSGWAAVGHDTSTNGTSDCTLNIWWKRAVAGDVGASNYTFGLSVADYAEGEITAVRGCITTGSPWDTGAGAPVFAHTSSPATTAPAVSLTTQGSDRLLWNGAANQTGGTPWTASSGFTKDFDTTGGGSFSTCTGYHSGQAVAGSTGNVQPVCPSSGEMVNFLGALLPPDASSAAFQALPPDLLALVLSAQQKYAFDGVAGTSLVALAESGTAGESIAATATVPVSDAGSASDTLAASATVPLTDSGSATDAATVTTTIPLPDTGSAADAISVNTGATPVTLTDTGSVSDAVTVAVTTPLGDTASASDALAITATIHVADTAAAADTFGMVAALALTEAAAALDSLAVVGTIHLADAAAGADAISVNTAGVINKALTDSGSASDSLCVETLRPDTGITTRPSAGTTAYATATMPRPGSGTTARPNTGTTDNPC